MENLGEFGLFLTNHVLLPMLQNWLRKCGHSVHVSAYQGYAILPIGGWELYIDIVIAEWPNFDFKGPKRIIHTMKRSLKLVNKIINSPSVNIVY